MTRLENGEEPQQQQQNTEDNNNIRSELDELELEQEQEQAQQQHDDAPPNTTHTSRTSATYDAPPTSYDGRDDRGEEKKEKGELYRSEEFEKNRLRQSIDIDDVKEIR